MSLFVAEAEPGGLQVVTAPRLEASIVHLEGDHGIVWLWVSKLHASQIQMDQVQFYVWNSGIEGAAPLKLASLEQNFCYKGLIRLVVAKLTLSAQRSSLSIPNIDPATWPETGGTLQEVIDAIDTAAPQEMTLQILKAIALHTPQNVPLGSLPPLQNWLASTAVSRARADLATPSIFADAMRQRPRLFAELARLVPEQRMVFLLGSKHSYLDEFLDGFQNYIETNCSEELIHVTARFNSDDFRQIHDQCRTLLPYPELDSLLASLAFAAANGLKQKAGIFPPGILTAEMLGKPVVFARSYLRNATQHDDHWQCIRHFLEFLTSAAQKSGVNRRLTIFLPFDKVEEVINGNDDARRHLWEGLGALRQQLETRPEHCPQLGIVLAVQDLAIDRTTEARFVRRILTIPPLSRAELDELLRQFWGSPPDTQELNVIDEYSGGDPWFVFLLLRCLRSHSKANKSVRGMDAITEVCHLALRAVRADSLDNSLESASSDVQADCNVYLAEGRSILRQYQGELGARIVLNAWEHPESYHAQRREIEKFERAWILTGLVYTQALKATRGDSLTSLHEYPRYQFCRAGKLPLAFAERILTVAKRQRGQK